MGRCEFRHPQFKHSFGYHNDGSGRCWMEKTANFGTEERPELYCIFHAPIDKIPLQTEDIEWPVHSRGVQQSRTLKRLINQWRADALAEDKVGHEQMALILPGLRCGDINLANEKLPGALIFDDAYFSGLTFFNKVQFFRAISMRNVHFEYGAEFTGAFFNGRADFIGATFNLSADFSSTTFRKTATFGKAHFEESVDFSESVFHGDADLTEAKIHGNATFWKSVFGADLLMHNTIIDGMKDFDGSEITGKVVP